MDNPFLKEINLKINEKVQKNKEIFEKEQVKAKKLFNDFKEHTLVQYEDAKEHLQEHVNHFNLFSENFKNHLTKSPFDFNSFSKSLFEYNKKSFEIVSDATKKQAERLSQLNDKIQSFYKNDLTSFTDATKKSENEVKNDAENDIIESKPTVKKTVARKTTKKTISK